MNGQVMKVTIVLSLERCKNLQRSAWDSLAPFGLYYSRLKSISLTPLECLF